MEYTKQEILSLINHLKSYGDTYEVLTDFFEGHYNEGHFNFGLRIPGQQSCAIIIKELKDMFPDIFFILNAPKIDLPLYINKQSQILQEYVIACWRLDL